MKTVYLFDFDFTLADSSRGVIDCAKYALSQVNEKAPGDLDILAITGMPLDTIYKHLTGKEDDREQKLFWKSFLERAGQILADMTVIYGPARDAIKKLHDAGMMIGIVSSKFRSDINKILERDGLAGYIDHVIGGEDVTNQKPHEEGLLKALEHFGVTGDGAVFIGDSLVDAQAAHNAGVDFIATLTGVTKREDFRDYNVTAFLEDLGGLGGLG